MAEEKQQSNYWTTERVNKIIQNADENGVDFKDVDNPFHENDPELRRVVYYLNIRSGKWRNLKNAHLMLDILLTRIVML